MVVLEGAISIGERYRCYRGDDWGIRGGSEAAEGGGSGGHGGGHGGPWYRQPGAVQARARAPQGVPFLPRPVRHVGVNSALSLSLSLVCTRLISGRVSVVVQTTTSDSCKQAAKVS